MIWFSYLFSGLFRYIMVDERCLVITLLASRDGDDDDDVISCSV